MREDLRDSLRFFRRRPGFAATAVLTLALGLGANAASFSLVNAVVFRPLPIRDPARVANLYMSRANGTSHTAFSYLDYRDLTDSSTVFDGVAGYTGFVGTVTGGPRAEPVFGELVTGNFFQVLGVNPVAGRAFRPDEDRTPGAAPVAVIGYGFWQRRFGGDPSAVGQSLILNGRPYRIVGVAPPGFNGVLVRGYSADLWVPTMMMGHIRNSRPEDRNERFLFVKARLAGGVTMGAAAAAVSTIGRRLERDHPGTNTGRRISLFPSPEVLINPDADRVIRPAAALLLAAAALLLMVVCANLAGLLLARASGRREEIAMRLALGAGRARIVRQMLVEGALLAGAGAAVAVLLAQWLAALIVGFKPPLPLPLSFDVGVDGRVIAYTAGLAALATVLTALPPALRLSRMTLAPSLRGGAEPAVKRRRWSFRQSLLVPQVAISFVLLLVAALFTRSVRRAGDVDPGFDLSRGAFVALNLGLSGYDEPRAAAFYNALRDRIASRPGVLSVAVTDRIPLDLYGSQSATLTPDASATAGLPVAGQTAHVDPGYFDVLGIPIQRGRPFSAADMQAGARVAAVSAETARRLWPGTDPVGRRLRLGDEPDASWLEVVGVAGDVKVQSLGEPPTPFVYLPLTAHTALLRVVMSVNGDPAAAVASLRADVDALDPGIGVFDSGTVRDVLDVMLFPFRMIAAVGTALGVFAVVLVGVGLYGLAAFALAGRRRELAVRVALGAAPANVVSLVLGDEVAAVIAGLAVGAPAAYAVALLSRAWLFGVAPADPLAFATAALAVGAVMVAAGIAPALAALRSRPWDALRME